MVLVCSQHQHELIPQAHSPGDDLKLASDLKTARNLMFQLFQQKAAEVAAAYPNEANSDRLYLKVRHVLDECPEVKATHDRRKVLQDRLWSEVLSAIDNLGIEFKPR